MTPYRSRLYCRCFGDFYCLRLKRRSNYLLTPVDVYAQNKCTQVGGDSKDSETSTIQATF